MIDSREIGALPTSGPPRAFAAPVGSSSPNEPLGNAHRRGTTCFLRHGIAGVRVGTGDDWGPRYDLALIDRKGGVEPLNLQPAPYQHPRGSPDGRQIAAATDDGKDANIWISELGSMTPIRQLTYDGKNRFPVWSADSQRIAFQSDREGDLGIFWQRADGSDAAERLTKPDHGTAHVPEWWSPNGEWLLFAITRGALVSLWAFSLRDKKSTQVAGVESPNPLNAVFSPDGQWIAYTAAAGANAGIYMHPFPTGAKFLVSETTAIRAVWSRDGKELVSQPPGGQWGVQAMRITPSFALGARTSFVSRGGAVTTGPTGRRNFDAMPNGRILGVVLAGQTQRADRQRRRSRWSSTGSKS